MKLVCSAMLLVLASTARAQMPLPPKYADAHRLVDSLRQFTGRLRAVYEDSSLQHGDKLLSKAYFDKFFSKWLSYVNVAKDGYPDGNSVLLAPNSAATRLRTTLASKLNNVIVNAGAEANFANNIANVITKRDVNAATSFFSSVSFLPKMSRKIAYDANRGPQNDSDKIELLEKFLLSAEKKYDTDYTVDSTSFQHLRDTVAVIKNAGGAPQPKLLLDYYAARDKLRGYGFNENQGFYDAGFLKTRIQSMKDSVQRVLDSIELNNDAIMHFGFDWFTGSFTYTHNDYTTYNGAAPFQSRIGDLPFDSLAFNVGFNYLFDRNQQYQNFAGTSFLDKKWLRSFFFAVNYNLARDLNYAHLTPVNVVTTQNITSGATDSSYQLQSQAKAVNITKIPKLTGWLHTFSAKTVVVFSKSSLMGWDLAFSAGYGKLVQPIYTAQVGAIFRFADSQSQKSTCNFELFLRLPDMADSQGTGQSAWQRKIIGINASIPFGKLFF